MTVEQMMWALKNGDVDALKQIVTKDAAFDVNSIIGQNRKPIHYAADYGQAEVIEYLISLGADVNATDGYGITPLLAAIYEGHKECVELLITKGANKNLKTPEGLSYLEAAEEDSIRELLK